MSPILCVDWQQKKGQNALSKSKKQKKRKPRSQSVPKKDTRKGHPKS